MRKKIFCLTMIFCMIMSTAISSFATNNEENAFGNNIRVLSCDYDGFLKFIEKPTLADAELKSFGFAISSIKKEGDGFLYSKDGTCNMIRGENDLHIGTLPVSHTFLTLLYNRDELQRMLLNYEICGMVENVTVLDVENMAATIWVTANRENYFITVDEQFEDYIYRTDATAYVYRVYTFDTYSERFGAKDGRLIVSKEDISADNYVKFHYTGVYLPLRATLEHLGVRVDWDANNNVILLCYEKKHYVFKPHTFELTEQGKEDNLLIIPPGMDYYYCKSINGRIVLDDEAMGLLLREFDANLFVNYEKQMVEVKKVSENKIEMGYQGTGGWTVTGTVAIEITKETAQAIADNVFSQIYDENYIKETDPLVGETDDGTCYSISRYKKPLIPGGDLAVIIRKSDGKIMRIEGEE